MSHCDFLTTEKKNTTPGTCEKVKGGSEDISDLCLSIEFLKTFPSS